MVRIAISSARSHLSFRQHVLTALLSKRVERSRVLANAANRLIDPAAMLIPIWTLVGRYTHPLDSLLAEHLAQVSELLLRPLLLRFQASQEVCPAVTRAARND